MATHHRKGIGPLVVAAQLLAGTACTLLIDTQGLSGGSPGGPDASLPDGGGSGPIEDAGDAATRIDASDGAAGRFCDGHADAIFCEDFDGPAVAATSIDAQYGAGTVAAAEDARSSPNVFVATVMTVPANQIGKADFKTPPIPSTTYHVSFDAFVVSGKSVAVAVVYANDSLGDNFQGQVLGDATFAIYQEYGATLDGGAPSVPSLNLTPHLTATWRRIDLCLDFVANTRTALVDGSNRQAGIGLQGWPRTATLFFGATYVPPGKEAQEVRIDNVLVDASPCPN